MDTYQIEKLKELYRKKSKHSNYQILASNFSKILPSKDLTIVSRYERERWEYIRQIIDFYEKKVIDIGGNTGYFSFETINAGAKHVMYFEGNESHAEFVKFGAKCIGVSENILVNNRYYKFTEENKINADIILLLNVLHHIGDDYEDSFMPIEKAKLKILDELNSMAKQCDLMVFQLGFNWKGNREMCLFEKGTKQEMINYIKNGIAEYWKIEHIGIAECFKEGIKYFELSDSNISRDDTLGEFLNRPIFILKSLCYK